MNNVPRKMIAYAISNKPAAVYAIVLFACAFCMHTFVSMCACMLSRSSVSDLFEIDSTGVTII